MFNDLQRLIVGPGGRHSSSASLYRFKSNTLPLFLSGCHIQTTSGVSPSQWWLESFRLQDGSVSSCVCACNVMVGESNGHSAKSTCLK